MKSKLFIDSDVVIDFFINRKPHVEKATKIFDLNEKNKITLFISALSINNIYYITRKYLGHRSTIEVVEELIDMFEIVGTNKQDIVQALNNNFSDFEDSIQYSTALKVNDLQNRSVNLPIKAFNIC